MENILYQHGTLGALMAGLMDGNLTMNDLLENGDFGIGTLHGLDGEVVVLNGRAYQARSTGEFVELNGSELTPYAAVTNFRANRYFFVDTPESSDKLKKNIFNHLLSPNLFAAIKISGVFDKMHVRVMPKQFPPYQKLVDVAKVQPEFTRNHVKGTIVGFFTPTLFQGTAAAGFHLHFIDETETFGGHILDFDLSHGLVEISDIETLTQHFPITDATFRDQTIDYSNVASEIEEAE
ncbi:acetolactate decarboxylase [Vagococcus penaei]|uniref:Alpha-acetolactate decarboxylase n=1 Tax=Vagococcus penaei TaxID=633807 RepID=A0A1Q2D7N1_9ENTE|nr:acetolactate decarboxylase [Vagococcus penaei]AQP54398.1 acetolactate decarboxylase [Vagococcus penaei]RSU06314.1 acetolactate decarboxylase [Vagococcus penaei]